MKQKMLLSAMAVLLGVASYHWSRKDCHGVCRVHPGESTVDHGAWIIRTQASESGPVYFIESRNGQSLPADLTEDKLRAVYPDLYQSLKPVLARKNDRMLSVKPKVGSIE